jgi:predicted nucleic acid-binding protein
LEHLDLLYTRVDELYVPTAVVNEIRAKPDMATQVLNDALQQHVEQMKVEDQTSVELLRADLDLGEAEVIVLAKSLRAERVVMDDLDARRFARRVGLNPVGTLGILLAARHQGQITSLQDEIDRLAEHGFRVAPGLVAKVLEAAGER